jgi:hypothetical protein
MKINAPSWTIVLAGNWNRYILSPEWAAKNIFDVEKLKIEFAVNINLSPRFSSPEVAMMPSEAAVIFMPLQQTDDCLSITAQLAQNLILKLPYTPMSAFGINFGFIEENPDGTLLSLFNFTDTQKLGEFGSDVKESGIVRRLLIDGKILNLTVNHVEAGVTFDFNFHYEVRDAEHANELLNGQAITNKNLAYKMISDIYNLEIEE